jgi:DNA-binding CsgD family transcriptional regulator
VLLQLHWSWHKRSGISKVRQVMTDKPSLDPRVVRVPPAYLALYPDLPARLAAAHDASNPEVRAAAAAMIEALASNARRQEAILIAQFDLTPAQARLAVHIRDGGTLADYSTKTGLTGNTVRQHLKFVFQKIGVKRQSELAALMLAGEGQ